MQRDVQQTLRDHEVQPTAQRVAIARYILGTHDHPSADEVFAKVRRKLAVLSRATVYNTLNLFVAKGLIRQFILAEGRVVFDPNVDAHHHFIDEETGAIHDIPWSALEVKNVDGLSSFDISEYQVVLRGRPKKRGPTRRS
jgi:Fur family iron response transcriptional regulator